MNQHSIVVFNRARKFRQIDRSTKTFAESDFLFRESADRLALHFNEVIIKKFEKVLVIGTRNGAIADIFRTSPYVNLLVETEVTPKFLKGKNEVICDEELLPFKDESFDLVVSNLSLHWVNDLPGCFAQIRRILKKDGLFCANIFGSRTLVELRNVFLKADEEKGVSPRISPFIDVKDGAGLLQRTKFEEPVAINEDITVKYGNLEQLLIDLRNTGETNALDRLSNRYVGKDFFKKCENIYRKDFSDEEGNLNATFEIITISGWKK